MHNACVISCVDRVGAEAGKDVSRCAVPAIREIRRTMSRWPTGASCHKTVVCKGASEVEQQRYSVAAGELCFARDLDLGISSGRVPSDKNGSGS
jgi:hypothetical protein